jgi:hypothetical protein
VNHPITLKETILQELETADEQLLEEVMQLIRGTASQDQNRAKIQNLKSKMMTTGTSYRLDLLNPLL